MWSADQYLNELYDASIKTHPKTYDVTIQKKLKQRLIHLLGGFTNTGKQPDPHILEKVDKGHYERLRIEITTVSSLKMPFYLLRPKEIKQNLPAVIAIHGHGYGSKEAVGLNPDGTLKTDEGYHKNFAIKLVEQGMIVVVPELIGFGDRKLQADQDKGLPTDNSCYMIASQLLLLGKTIAGLRIEECMSVIDLIQTLPEVDQTKIGCMGISGGGLVASYLSAVDERIKATVISGYTNTFHASIMARRHCLDNYIPGILLEAEMPDLIGLIAPRPLFIEAGKADHLFPVKNVEQAIERLTYIYERFKAEASLYYHIFEGGHEINGTESIKWLTKQLSPSK